MSHLRIPTLLYVHMRASCCLRFGNRSQLRRGSRRSGRLFLTGHPGPKELCAAHSLRPQAGVRWEVEAQETPPQHFLKRHPERGVGDHGLNSHTAHTVRGCSNPFCTLGFRINMPGLVSHCLLVDNFVLVTQVHTVWERGFFLFARGDFPS